MSVLGEKSEKLFGLFADMLAAYPGATIEDYYGRAMHQFAGASSWDQTWDVAAIHTLIEDAGPGRIIDVGGGSGRLTERLRHRGLVNEIVSVDVSEFAAQLHDERWAGDDSATFVKFEIGSGGWRGAAFDTAIMGCVSVNGFSESTDLQHLFEFVGSALKPQGSFVLNVYADETLAKFETLDGVVDGTPFTHEGVDGIIWRGLRYSKEVFLQNALVQMSDAPLPGVLCALQERIWSSSEVIEFADSLGWVLTGREPARVGDGGAEGWLVDTLRFQRLR